MTPIKEYAAAVALALALCLAAPSTATLPPPAQADIPCEKPLAAQDVADLLKGGVPEVRVKQFVTTCKVDFELTEEIEKRFRFLGATDSLLFAITRNYQPPKPPTVSLRADKMKIKKGESVRLSWESSHADDVFLEPGLGKVEASGSRLVSPQETTAYRIVARGPGGETERSLTIYVSDPGPAAAQTPELPPRGDDAHRASKNGRTEGSIDGVDIIVTYGRLKVKGRVIWGGLVGYGKVWRSGANEATVIWFSRDVSVEGKRLAQGAYSLWTIPAKGDWTVIFNKTTKLWGTGYSSAADNDALRVKVTPKPGEHVEEMEFVIEENRVVLRWEKLATGFTVAAAK